MKKVAIIIFAILGVTGALPAQTLEDYQRIAAENNPELKAYFLEYMAAMEEISQAGSLPDPELTVGFFLQPMDRFMGTQLADIRLMQMFPWFGTLGARKTEADKMALAKYEIFRNAKNRLFYQVKETWFGMYRLEEEIQIAQENLDILKKYERMALIRFQSAGTGSGSMPGSTQMKESSQSSASSMGNMGAGMNTGDRQAKAKTATSYSQSSMGSAKSGMSDVLRVRMEIKELENRLELLKDSRIPLIAEFNRLLNRDLSESISIPDTVEETALTIERQALLDSITQNNPMLKMLDAEKAAHEVQEKMARLEGRPMLGAGVNYMPFKARTENGMPMGGNDMVMPMISVTIPIFRGKYNAMRKEAELKQQAVQQRRKDMVNDLSTQWSATMRNLDDATRRIDLYREQSELAGQTLNLLTTSYTADGSDFEEVLRVQQQLLDYQLKLVTAIVDQHVALAALEMLAATELK